MTLIFIFQMSLSVRLLRLSLVKVLTLLPFGNDLNKTHELPKIKQPQSSIFYQRITSEQHL